MDNNNKYFLMYKRKEKEKKVIDDTPSSLLHNIENFSKNSSQFIGDDKFQNMLIFGNNLPILKTLINLEKIKEKVKLVYIDPPFSTNQHFRGGGSRVSTISSSLKDKIAYSDSLIGKEYLEYLRKRLILLRELLADDGSIYVHIDWKKGHYVKVLMDEIFGEENFINDIARVKCNPKNFPRPAYGNIKDMVLFYSKSKKYIWNESLEEYSKADILKLFPKIDQKGRRYTTNPLHAPGETKNGATGMPWKGMNPPSGRHWRYKPEVLDELDKNNLIEWSKNGNPRKIIFASDFIKKKKKRQDIWQFKDPAHPKYPTQKNLKMLKEIISASSNPGDIVLDCFAGSGSTLVAADGLDRRWIGIDNSEIAIETALNRLLSLKSFQPFAIYQTDEELLSDAFQKIFQKQNG